MALSVIVVEDDEDSGEVLAEYLSLKDIKVLAKAKDGKEAFEIYKKFKPEIVLLDVLMPGYDGFYALNQIKEYDKNSKVIFVTAAIDKSTQNKLFEANVEGIVFKPFEMDHLIDTIQLVSKGEKFIPPSVRSMGHSAKITK